MWKLLTPVGRRIDLESLNGRRLAIDVSIWLYQFQMAMRDKKTGDALQGAHIMGTFRRILKLKFFGIKPVFVFDGDAPMLKKRTILARKARKTSARMDHRKTAQMLMNAQLRKLAAESQIAKTKKRIAQKQARVEAGDGDDLGEEIAADAVYLDQLERARPSTPPRSTKQMSIMAGMLASPSPGKKFVPRDEYALPTLDQPLHARGKPKDQRLPTAEEIRQFQEEDIMDDVDLEGDYFKSLPDDVKYDIVSELRMKSRQVNHRRVQEMKANANPLDFSLAQVENLMNRNTLTQKLFHVTDALGQSNYTEQLSRIAGERNREYVLVKADIDKGGGWVLGMKNPAVTATGPITLDSSSDVEGSVQGAHSDDEPVERVKRQSTQPAKSSQRKYVSPEEMDRRRHLAIEAIKKRYAPQLKEPELDPLIDSAPLKHSAQSLFQAAAVDDEDADVQAALLEAFAPKSQNKKSSRAPVAGGSGLTAAQKQAASSTAFVDVPTAPDLAETRLMAAQPSTAALLTPSSDIDSDAFEEVDVERAQTPPTSVKQPAKEDVIDLASSSPPAQPPHQPLAPRTTFFVRESSAQDDRTLLGQLLDQSDSEDSDLEVTERATALAAQRSPTPPATEEMPVASKTPSPPPAIAQPREPSPEPQPQSRNEAFDEIAEEDIDTAPATDSESEMEMEEVAIEEPASKDEPMDEAELPPLASADHVPVAREARDPVSTEESDSATEDMRKVEEIESEEFFEWESSPEPAPQARPAQSLFLDRDSDESGSDSHLPREYGYEDELEDLEAYDQAEQIKALRREEEEYANFSGQLQRKTAEEMHREAREDVARLLERKNAEQRSADSITQQMVHDIKQLLQLFGIPFVEAPQEAEAECADLLERHLVDGIVTDDSDVFLFGGTRVYRNFFADAKYVECYLISDFEQELGLDRDGLVRLAYLLGGDYSDGLLGVGPVTAREILREFPGKDGLSAFRSWWELVSTGKDSESDTNTPWKRKFKRAHSKLHIDALWPNPRIAQAYYKPSVVGDADDAAFQWSPIDVDGLCGYMQHAIDWAPAKTSENLGPLLKREKERKAGTLKHQTNLADYFDISAGLGPLQKRHTQAGYGSSRLQNVLNDFRKKRASQPTEEPSSEDEPVQQPAPKRKRKAAPRRAQTEDPVIASDDLVMDESTMAALEADAFAQVAARGNTLQKKPARRKKPTQGTRAPAAAGRDEKASGERNLEKELEELGVFAGADAAAEGDGRAVRPPKRRAAGRKQQVVQDEASSDDDGSEYDEDN